MDKTRKPNPIDVHVGSRVRLRRSLIDMSQEKLAEHLGITFQQVQKYEKGTNRMSASRLLEISRALQSPVSFFFEDLPDDSRANAFAEAEASSYVVDFLSTSQGLQLNRAFLHIKDGKVRQRIVELVKALAAEGG